MSGRGDAGGIVQTMVERATPVPGDLAADTLAADYGTGVHPVDYKADPEACRVLINAWVKERTHGKIPELLVRGTVTDEHALALTNALWFKARWMHEFFPSAIHQATVTVDEQGTEAAAATAVMGVAASVREPVEPVTVVVDRPFYFAITITDDLLPLFLGRVTDPTTK